ncbi:hypothetical protein CALVIDRAFT_527365 [Calocera viscosa TUFC12733]|uniref:Uncharacterized protein n=1 Tax=Calocera viscosa (strain TUFC12733) TaxID=1330018 RepID=A0A167MG71_CALVF|nr:hypothetical protein CALVIDRAFT_527365 [Calocera viscosa TUFC12733]
MSDNLDDEDRSWRPKTNAENRFFQPSSQRHAPGAHRRSHQAAPPFGKGGMRPNANPTAAPYPPPRNPQGGLGDWRDRVKRHAPEPTTGPSLVDDFSLHSQRQAPQGAQATRESTNLSSGAHTPSFGDYSAEKSRNWASSFNRFPMGQGDAFDSRDLPPPSQLHMQDSRPLNRLPSQQSKHVNPPIRHQRADETGNASAQQNTRRPSAIEIEDDPLWSPPRAAPPRQSTDAARQAHTKSFSDSFNPGDIGPEVNSRSTFSNETRAAFSHQQRSSQMGHETSRHHSDPSPHIGSEEFPLDSQGMIQDPELLSVLIQATRAAKRREKQLKAVKKVESAAQQMTVFKKKALEQMKKGQEKFQGLQKELDNCKEGGKKVASAVADLRSFLPGIQDLRNQVKEGIEAITPLIGISDKGFANQHAMTRATINELMKEKENSDRDYTEARQTIDLLRSQMEHNLGELAEAKGEVTRLQRRQEEDKTSLQIAQEAKALYEQVKQQDLQARQKQNSEVIDCIVKAAEMELQNEKLNEEIKRLQRAEQVAVEDLKSVIMDQDQSLVSLKNQTSEQHATIAACELELKRLTEHWKEECDSLRARQEQERQEKFLVGVEKEKQALELVSQRTAYEEKLGTMQEQCRKMNNELAALQERYQSCNDQRLKNEDLMRKLQESMDESDAGASLDKALLNEKVSDLDAIIQRLNSDLLKSHKAVNKKQLEEVQKHDRQKSKDTAKLTSLEKELKQCKQFLETERQRAQEEKRHYQDEGQVTGETVIKDDMQKAYDVDELRAKNEIHRLQSEYEKAHANMQRIEKQYKEHLAKVHIPAFVSRLHSSVWEQTMPSQSSISATPTSFALLNDPVPGELHEVSSRARPVRHLSGTRILFGPTSPMSTDDDADRRPPVSTVNPMDTIGEPASKKRGRPDDQDADYLPPKARRGPSVVPTSKARSVRLYMVL